jgi:hypothetical protein
MNSFNEEVCEYTSTPVTVNFNSCGPLQSPDNFCESGCRRDGWMGYLGPCVSNKKNLWHQLK